MNSESFPHPGGNMPPFVYKAGDPLVGTNVWYISGDDADIHWYHRRNGPERPTLTRHPGVIDKQIDNFVRVKLDKGIMHWLNLYNTTEKYRVQRR